MSERSIHGVELIMRLYRSENAGMVMILKFSIAIAILCFGISVPALAQEADILTFTTEDQSFSFDYPADWTVEVINPDYPNPRLSVDNLPLDRRFESPDGVNLQIYLPKRSFLVSPYGDTPKEAVMGSIAASQEFSIAVATQMPSSTSQPLQFDSNSPEVGEFLVVGRSAAYAYNISNVMGIDASYLYIVADLGNDYWVIIAGTSVAGGLETIKRYEPLILSLIQSMRYVAPPPAYSGNPDLPQVYSGLIGIWHRGYTTFYYPDDWYVSYPIDTVFISNLPSNPFNVAPESGQFIALVNGVPETRAFIEPRDVFNQCDTVKDELTARTLTEKMLSNITPAQLEQIADAGITNTQPEVTTVNGKEIVYMRQYQADFEVLSMFIDLGDGNIQSMIVTTKQGEMAQFEEQLFAVAGTFQYEPKPCDPVDMGTPTGS